MHGGQPLEPRRRDITVTRHARARAATLRLDADDAVIERAVHHRLARVRRMCFARTVGMFERHLRHVELENIQRWQLRVRTNAVPQIDREAEVASPQRKFALTVFARRAFGALDPVHRKRART